VALSKKPKVLIAEDHASVLKKVLNLLRENFVIVSAVEGGTMMGEHF